jgi:hypothetical protein
MPHRPYSNHRRGAEEDDEGLEAQRAQPDDLVMPVGIEAHGKSPPFGILCSLYDRFEEATRNKHKKPSYKADLLSEFFKVRFSLFIFNVADVFADPARRNSTGGTTSVLTSSRSSASSFPM